MQYIKDGCLRHDELLEIFRMEIVAIDVNG
jgi:hypothetical protein